MKIKLSHRISLALSILILCSHPGQTEQNPIQIKKTDQNEKEESFERKVDEVALLSQEKAIKNLKKMIQKNEGSSEECTFLLKLADMEQQKASILFRITHGKKNTPEYKRYEDQLNESIRTFSKMIEKFPHSKNVAYSYFSRAKAYEELNDIKTAKRDYLYLVKNFKDALEVPASYMALASFAMEANQHEEAIEYLNELEKRPQDPHYPFALYKMAWSYFNLKQVDKALKYAEKQIDFYNNKKMASKPQVFEDDTILSSDQALEDTTLQDIALFYFDGYEKKLDHYNLENALDYFKKVESGPSLGKMLLRFSKLLRSRDLSNELIQWKNNVLTLQLNQPEILEMVFLIFEYQNNQKNYSELIKTANEIHTLYPSHPDWEGFQKAKKILLETAENIQNLIIKNKKADNIATLSETLKALYDSYLSLIPSQDPIYHKVHYNLAETLFTIEDYEGAAKNYRWVADHLPSKSMTELKDAELKAVASRYKTLKLNKLIPDELKPKKGSQTTSEKEDPLLSEWIQWIDQLITKDASKEIHQFHFESSRALYSMGEIDKSINRILDHLQNYSNTDVAIPEASLVLDTYVIHEDWSRVEIQSQNFLKISNWKDSSFNKKLTEIASQSVLKKMEALFNEKSYQQVLEEFKRFTLEYKNSNSFSDALELAGQSALALNQKELAENYLNQLISYSEKKDSNTPPHSRSVQLAFLARAQIKESNDLLLDAANDYSNYIQLRSISKKSSESESSTPSQEHPESKILKKIFLFYWLEGKKSEILKLTQKENYCNFSPIECEKFKVLSQIPLSTMTAREAYTQAKENENENRGYLSVIALQKPEDFDFRERNRMLRWIGAQWKNWDPLIQFSFLPSLLSTIPRTLELNRTSIDEIAPLKPDEKYISRRIDVIREFENAATAIVVLPFAKIQKATLKQNSILYSEFSKQLKDLSTPKNLSSEELQVYKQTIQKIANPFDEKSKQLAKELDKLSKMTQSSEYAEELLNSKLDLDLWLGAQPQAKQLVQAWNNALQNGNWAKVTFVLQKAKQSSFIDSQYLSLMRALTLDKAGAHEEALSEMKTAPANLPIKQAQLTH